MSSIGRSCACSITTKTTSKAIPATSEPRIWPLVQPALLPRSSAKTMRKSEAARVTRPRTSVRRAFASRDSRTRVIASQAAAAPIGTLTKKIHRQPRESVRMPPTSGPDATASPTVEPQIAIARARARPSYSAPMSASAVANRAAPPVPCSARATSSEAMFQATPQGATPC